MTVTVAGVTSPALAAEQFSYLTVTGTNFGTENVHRGNSVGVFGFGFVAGQSTVTLTPAGTTTGGQTWTVASQSVTVNSTGTTLSFPTPFQPASAVGAYLITVRTPYGTSVSPTAVSILYAGPATG